jgi:hypothetical protein
MSKWEKEDETPYLVSFIYLLVSKLLLTIFRSKFTNKTRSERKALIPARHHRSTTPMKAPKTPLAKKRVTASRPAKKKQLKM